MNSWENGIIKSNPIVRINLLTVPKMESRLAEVVDKTVIVEVDTELSLCSCESDVVDETCSLGGDDTR